MPSRESTQERSLRKAHDRVGRAIADIRQARIAAGMSQQALAGLVKISRSRISRIERGEEPDVPALLLARMAVFVGLDLGIRAYPGGDPMLDVAQVRLLSRLRERLGPGWDWAFEVALPTLGDLRAWDAVATCRATGVLVHVEAETRLEDIQALLRRFSLKCRDGGANRMVLLVADTRHNRDVVRAAEAALHDAFPAELRRALPSLADGRDPGADLLLLI